MNVRHKIKRFKQINIIYHPIDCELVAMDGTEHTNDYTDHYCAKIKEENAEKATLKTILQSMSTQE